MVCAGLAALWSLALMTARFPGGRSSEDEPYTPFREALRSALTHRTPMLWLLGGGLCIFLDEILVAFGALYMRDVLDFGAAQRSTVLSLFGLGCAVGHLFVPLEVLAPLGLGLLADRFGLATAMLVLTAQPIGLLAIAIHERRQNR